MAHKLTKKKRQELRKKRNAKKVKKLEKQDAKGISRKKIKKVIRPELFVILKIISIVSIPVLYIVYSPLLVVAIIYTILLFIVAKRCEKYINHTFIKENHIKINKFDSVLASFVLIITIASACLGGRSTKHNQDNFLFEFKMKCENIGSCLTGRRSLINTHSMNFGTAEVPPDLPSRGDKPKEMDISDLPLEAIFSMMLSSVNSVLIFLVPLSGGASLLMYFVKRHRFDEKMNEVITDDICILTEEDFNRIFTFDMDYIEPNEKKVETIASTIDDE